MDLYGHYWNLEQEIIHQCYDEERRLFNWKLWFERRDEIIWTAPEEVLRGIDSDIRNCGMQQIYMINAIVDGLILSTEPFNPLPGLARLRQTIYDTDILLNLESMFCFQLGQSTGIAPQYVTDLRRILYDIMYNPSQVTFEKMKTISQLGHSITG